MTGLLGYAEALSTIRRVARNRKLGVEVVSAEEGVGRIASETRVSPEQVPGFDNTAMDGFAVRARELEGASGERGVELEVLGTLAAGDSPSFRTVPAKGVCFEIMTGAPMPAGFDAVVKVEDTRRLSERRVLALTSVRVGDNIRTAGEDFRKGSEVVAAGEVLHASHLLALLGLGITELHVFKRAKIAILSTGKELVPPETRELGPGQIRNSTGPYLQAALRTMGYNAHFHGEVGDSPVDLRKRLERVLETERPDVVLTTGAVSMGKYDFIPAVLAEMGAEIHFHKVAIRPGKPVLFGELGNSLFFGLPGNPVSTAVGLRFFVVPALRSLSGLPPSAGATARLQNSFRKPEGLRCFFKARVTSDRQAGLTVEILKGQASFMVHSLRTANAWVVLPEEASEVPEGTVLEVFPVLAHEGFEE